mgnify:FL=1
MGNNYKYFVVKDRSDLSITYFEYDKVQGYDLNPRNVKIKDAIDVNKMIVINPSMIEKLAFRKVNSKFNKLYKLVMFLFNSDLDDDSVPTGYREALNEITKLRLELYTKYKNKLNKEDEEMFNNKLDMLEYELNMRLMYIQNIYQNNYYYNQEKSGKSR